MDDFSSRKRGNRILGERRATVLKERRIVYFEKSLLRGSLKKLVYGKKFQSLRVSKSPDLASSYSAGAGGKRRSGLERVKESNKQKRKDARYAKKKKGQRFVEEGKGRRLLLREGRRRMAEKKAALAVRKKAGDRRREPKTSVSEGSSSLCKTWFVSRRVPAGVRRKEGCGRGF